MTDYNPNRPAGSGVPPERDPLPGDRRLGETPPEYRGGPPRGDGGNSAMALIVGALAVALIIGAFFWFAGDTQDTAILEEPATVQENTVNTDEPAVTTDDDAVGTDEEAASTEQDTTTTTPTDDAEPAEDAEVIDESQQSGTSTN